MIDESAFLAAIQAEPEKEGPRLIYADWLEEQGEVSKSEYMRLECELAKPQSLNEELLQSHVLLETLSHSIPRDWLQAIARPVHSGMICFQTECRMEMLNSAGASPINRLTAEASITGTFSCNTSESLPTVPYSASTPPVDPERKWWQFWKKPHANASKSTIVSYSSRK